MSRSTEEIIELWNRCYQDTLVNISRQKARFSTSFIRQTKQLLDDRSLQYNLSREAMIFFLVDDGGGVKIATAKLLKEISTLLSESHAPINSNKSFWFIKIPK